MTVGEGGEGRGLIRLYEYCAEGVVMSILM